MSFRKCVNKKAQQIENTFESVLAIQNTFESVLPKQNTFEIYLLGLFTHNIFEFFHTHNNYCYHNCTIRTLLLCK